MLNPSLIDTLFKAADMQRWNDRIRPVEMRELDKQAHKMIIAFALGRSLENKKKTMAFDWIRLIEGGFFEFLQRVVLTDLKPELFERIQADRVTFRKLLDWVFDQVRTDLDEVSPELSARCREWFTRVHVNSLEGRVLRAAHAYATRWEFRILEHAAPPGFGTGKLRERLEKRLTGSAGRDDIALPSSQSGTAAFIDLCGELRFQVRWSHLSNLPRVSVLGHMLIVAFSAYLLSIELKAVPLRRVNNFFTGLFHDLPEVLTRDIIDPVKRSVAGLDTLIKNYEKQEMDEKVLALLPKAWHSDIRLYTENEFESSILINGMRKPSSTAEICKNYNLDEYSPRDGELIRACDHLAAFVETRRALESGFRYDEILRAHRTILADYRGKRIAGVPIGVLFERMGREPGPGAP